MTETKLATEESEAIALDKREEFYEIWMNGKRYEAWNWILKECVFKDDLRKMISELPITHEEFVGGGYKKIDSTKNYKLESWKEKLKNLLK